MVIDINDTLLESIKKELLATLNEAERRVVDMFDFGETHGSDETLALLRSVNHTLLMIGEPQAANLCDAIYEAIKKSLAEDNLDEDSELANSFLTLSQYVERLSASGTSNRNSDLETQLLANAQKVFKSNKEEAPQSFKLSDKQKKGLTQALKTLGELKPAQEESFWQGLYKSARVTKKLVNTQESHELIWLIEQLAILNLKGTRKSDIATIKKVFATYGNYLKALVKDGETLVGYQQDSIAQGVELLKQETKNQELVRNDYRPPAYRLQSMAIRDDDLNISVIFPVSAETIEAIAFLIKREIAETKGIFEKALAADTLQQKETKDALLESLKGSIATFKLLAFNTGYSLLDEAKELLTKDDKDWHARFAENVVLVEDALWQLEYLESGGIVNVAEALQRQQAHSKEMAKNAAIAIVAQYAFEHFKAARESLIEHFQTPEKLDLITSAKEAHVLNSAMTLIGKLALAEQLSRAEQLQLFLVNKPIILKEKNNADTYMDMLVSYEIIFEQLHDSLVVDERALSLVTDYQKKLATGIKFDTKQLASRNQYLSYASKVKEDKNVDALIEELENAQLRDKEKLEAELSTEQTLETIGNEPESGVGDSDMQGGASGETVVTTEVAGGTPSVGNDGISSSAMMHGISPAVANLVKDAVPKTDIETVADADIDDETLEVFLQEGSDIAKQLKSDIPKLKNNYFDEALITNIRRAFHTLKGSGRMVGLNALGEFAWQHEELFNKALSNALNLNDVTQELLVRSQLLVEQTVNSEPFHEEKDKLLLAAAQMEALRNMMLSGDSILDVLGKEKPQETVPQEQPSAPQQPAPQPVAPQQPAPQPVAQTELPIASSQSQPVDETQDRLQKISKTAELISSLGGARHEDLGAIFQALNSVDKSGLDDSKQQLAQQLSEVANLSRESAGSRVEQSDTKNIANAIKLLSESATPEQLSQATETLSAIQDQWKDNQKEAKTAWAIDYIASALSLYDGWQADDFAKGTAFSKLHQHTVAFERMLLSNHIESPIALCAKLGQLFDAILRDKSGDKIDEVITGLVKLSLEEIQRLLEAIRNEEDTVAESDILISLDDAIQFYTQQSIPTKVTKASIDDSETSENDRESITTGSEQLFEYVSRSAPKIEASRNHFDEWESSNYEKNQAFDNLRKDTKDLKKDAVDAEHIDSVFVTEALSTTLDSVADADRKPTATEADTVKSAIDDLARMHSDISEGRSGKADPSTVRRLMDSVDSLKSKLSTGERTVASDEEASVAHSEQLFEYVRRSAPKIEASRNHFDEWESSNYAKNEALDNLRKGTEALKQDAVSAEHIDSVFVTEALTTTLDSVADADRAPTASEAGTVKSAINDLVRMHDDINNGRSGKADPMTVRKLMDSVDSLQTQPAKNTESASQINSDTQQPATVQNVVASDEAIDPVDSLQTQPAKNTESASQINSDTQQPTIVQNVVASDEAMADTIPNEKQTVVQNVASTNAQQPAIVQNSISPEGVDLSSATVSTETPVIYETGYLGTAGELRQTIEQAKKQFDPEFLSKLDFTHNNVIDSLYDIEASLNEADTPAWAWEALSNLESAIGSMEKRALQPAPEDYERIKEALDAINSNEEISPQDAKRINNSLMGLRAQLKDREEIAALAKKFAETAKQELDSVDNAYSQWRGSGFVPTQELSELIGNVEEVSERAKTTNYSDADELAQLVNSVLNRLHEQQLIPHKEVEEIVSEAISEMTTVSPQNHGGKLASDEMKSWLQEQVVVPKIGVEYISFDEADGADLPVEAVTPSALEHSLATQVPVMATAQQPATATHNEPETPPKLGEFDVSDDELSLANADELTLEDDELTQERLMRQRFVEKAGEHIGASRSYFDYWEQTGFTDEEPLARLSGHVKGISEISSEFELLDETALSSSVSEVLGRIYDDVLIPNEEAAQSVNDAIEEFNRSAEATKNDEPIEKQRIRKDLIEKLRAIEAMASLGEPITLESTDYNHMLEQRDARSGENSAEERDIVSRSLDVLNDETPNASSEEVATANDHSEGGSVYLPYVTEAEPFIEESKEHFDRWKASDFEVGEELESLSSSVSDISDISQKHGFYSGAELGQSIGDMLSQISDEGVVPDQETTEQISEAIDEFSRSADAIKKNDKNQEIRTEVLSKVKAMTKVTSTVADFDLSISDMEDEIDELEPLDTPQTLDEKQSIETQTVETETIEEMPTEVEGSPYLDYANAAQPFIDDSKVYFNKWKDEAFELTEAFEKLTTGVRDITEVSNRFGFTSGSELGENVSSILSQISDEGLAPTTETANQVGGAIDEFSRSADAIRRNVSGQDIRREILESTLKVARELAEVEKVEEEAREDEITTASPYNGYAEQARSAIEVATLCYIQWKSEAFVANSRFELFFKQMQTIKVASETHQFDTALALSGAVINLLPHISVQNGMPNEETEQALNDAVEEFVRSLFAIETNRSHQEIAQTVIDRVIEVTPVTEEIPEESEEAIEETVDENTIDDKLIDEEALEETLPELELTEETAEDEEEETIIRGVYSDYADAAKQPIESVNSLFSQWANDNYAINDNFTSLNDNFTVIYQLAVEHVFDSGAHLVEHINDSFDLIREYELSVTEDNVQPILQAISELSRSIEAIDTRAENQEIDPSVISATEAMLISLTDIAEESLIEKSPYIDYAQAIADDVASLPVHFEEWQVARFEPSEALESLSATVKSINKISEAHEFSSAVILCKPLNEVFSFIQYKNALANEEIVARIKKALDEFTRCYQAIEDNAEDQHILDSVISNIRLLATQMKDENLTAPYPAEEMHDLFIDSKATGLRGSLLEETVNEEKTDSVDSMMQEAMSSSSYEGLKFNDPNELDTTILEIFLSEAKDIVRNSQNSLEAWHDDYDDLSSLQEIQRGLHTLKGGARMAELSVLGDLSHNIETLLDAIVDGQVNDFDGAYQVLKNGLSLTDTFVMLADNFKVIVESPEYYDELNDFLVAQTGKSLDLPRPERAESEDGDQAENLPASPTKRNKKRKAYDLKIKSDLIDDLTGLIGEDVVARSRIERQLSEHSFHLDELSRTVERVSEQLRRLENETEAQILFRHDSSVPEINETDFDPLELDRFSEIQQLSRLLAESMHDLQSIRSSLTNFVDDSRQILLDQNNIQRELQDGVLSASLVKFSSIAPRFERLVEQVSSELGKEVRLKIIGGESDVERTMLADLVAGFEHTIRNSLAHGIEMPDEREKAGKPRYGTISVAVRREGAEVGFMISDDGRGANLDAIRNKARNLNMLDELRANDKEYLLSLLFEAGFSTAGEVGQLSGRGIGMDVLRDVVDMHQGAIDVESEDGKGMSTFIRMPFAMSITEALAIRVGRYTYAVPVMSIEGVARLPRELYESFELGQVTYYNYGRNRYRLESLVDFIDPYAEKVLQPQGVPVVLVRAGTKRLAFEVEDIYKRQEIIIKSVNSQFTTLPGIIGATILDNGLPVPVMEVTTLARHFLSLQDKGQDVRDLLRPQTVAETTQKPRILVVDDSITMRKVTTNILDKYDVESRTAKDGLDAVDVLVNWTPDVILLDIEMPRMDGFEFATHVRNDSDVKDIPIIMITSRTGDKHRERANSIGVNDYLGKPYSEETLIKSLQAILGKELKK